MLRVPVLMVVAVLRVLVVCVCVCPYNALDKLFR